MFFSLPDEAFYSYLQKELLSENETWLILAGENSKLNLSEVGSILKTKTESYYGGYFPGVIFDTAHSSEGVVLKKIPLIKDGLLVNLEDIEEKGTAYFSEISSREMSILLLVDGLSTEIERFLRKLQQVIPHHVPLIGGGAGSISLQQQPCLFSHDGIFENAALILPMSMEIDLAAKHGWERIAGPVVASKVNQNLIQELNWVEAFTVYEQFLDEFGKEKIDHADFFASAKSFPFGIYREASEDLVRDPIAFTKDGELVCVGEVPENSMLYLLKGIPENIKQAAKEVGQLLTEKNKNVSNAYQMFLVDCVSRSLFLEEDFSSELSALKEAFVNQQNWPKIEGILSIGEISSDRKGALVFFNKTIVGAIFKPLARF